MKLYSILILILLFIISCTTTPEIQPSIESTVNETIIEPVNETIIEAIIEPVSETEPIENESTKREQLEEIIIGHQIKVFDSETFGASDPRHYPSIFQYLFLYDGTFFAFDNTMRMRLGTWETYTFEDGTMNIELITHETTTIMNVMIGLITDMTDEGFTVIVKGGLEIEFHRTFYEDDDGLTWIY